MDRAAFDEFTVRLTAWAEQTPSVLGLVTLGSAAGISRQPDEWSDHDFFVVAREGEAQALRDDLSWLPYADRIAVRYAETLHGRGAIYDDGHLIEFGVFEASELSAAAINDFRVLVDDAEVADRMATISRNTAIETAGQDENGSFRYHQLLKELVIGLGRDARGERLSANARVRGAALRSLLSLLGQFVPSESADRLDNLDPHRRFELAHPGLATRLAEALERPIPDIVDEMLAVIAETLAGRLPVATQSSLDSVRVLLDRTRRAEPASVG